MAKPKLALIPAAQGTSLYSVLPSSGVGDFNFTRSGSATRINSQGLIETVGSGVSRLNYPMIDGVVKGCPSHILEPASTNRIIYSEELNNSNWSSTRLDVLSNETISPNGSLNADLLRPTATANGHSIGNVSLVDYNSQKSTVSFFAKFNGYNISASVAGSPSSWTGCIFDLENGIARTPQNSGSQSLCSSEIENYGNGWYRCSITFTPYTSGTFYNFWGTVDNSDANLTSFGLQEHTADGINGVYLWGCQSEVNQSYLTSYIKTTTAAVTRSAETATGSGNAATFNDSEGVLMAEISGFNETVSANNWISLTDGTTNQNNYVSIQQDTSGNIIGRVRVNGVNSAVLYSTIIDQSLSSKIAIKYKLNDFSLYVNGFEYDSNNVGSIFSTNTLSKLSFDYNSLSNPFYGNTKQLQYYDTTDIDLEQLTSWVSFLDMAEGQLYSVE